MNVSKEDFKKLKQLDRIEFMLRHNKINENKPHLDMSIFSVMFDIVAFLIIFYLLLFLVNSSYYIKIFILIPLVFKIGFIIFFICLIVFIFQSVIHNKKLKELNKEFFKIEVKK